MAFSAWRIADRQPKARFLKFGGVLFSTICFGRFARALLAPALQAVLCPAILVKLALVLPLIALRTAFELHIMIGRMALVMIPLIRVQAKSPLRPEHPTVLVNGVCPYNVLDGRLDMRR